MAPKYLIVYMMSSHLTKLNKMTRWPTELFSLPKVVSRQRPVLLQPRRDSYDELNLDRYSPNHLSPLRVSSHTYSASSPDLRRHSCGAISFGEKGRWNTCIHSLTAVHPPALADLQCIHLLYLIVSLSVRAPGMDDY